MNRICFTDIGNMVATRTLSQKISMILFIWGYCERQIISSKEGIKQSKSIIPQSMTEKNHQNYKYRMALNQPVLDMKLEIKG